nr:RNA-directed DNA polymerase, eukaryota, reverse transcriptase zinc-binding domain protein [Tanacetum cinerariifolium]
MDGLHVALSYAVQSGLIRGVKFCNFDFSLSHLFYADDVVISLEWSSFYMDNIIRILQVFHLASGIKINIHKSNVYGIGVSTDEVSHMTNNTGCASGSFSFVYLGLPIGANMCLTSNWKILIDRFLAKLSNWKENLLSIGGRLTLIKSVLGSLGIYYLSIFKVPECTLKSLESIRASFFWGGYQNLRKLAWIKWPNILSFLDKCVLGIGNLKSFNLALLQKWSWRMYFNLNAFWVKVIKALHGYEGGFDYHGCKTNGIWAKIVGSSNYLHSSGILPGDSIRFQVGCGNLIRFWKDTWLGNSPLHIRYNRLFRFDLDRDCLIRDPGSSRWFWWP